MTLSSIKLAEVEKKRELNEDEVLVIIQKEVKSRHEAIEDAQRADRPELIKAQEDEIAILKTYLPEELSEAELEDLARQAIEEAGATDIRQMGQVMKVLMPRLQGRATGQQASQTVRKLLA